ncbi:MAG: cytochrome P450 [Deltaproteobacteria bacterium]|nr:cytochrome P450 [Deltaproteobacteria bacterium]
MPTLLHPPGPKGKPFVGSLIDFYRDILGFLTKSARDYGDISYFKLGPREAFLLNHSDLIKDVLVTHHRNFLRSRALERAKLVLGEGLLTSERDVHLRQRRIIQSAFHHKRIASYGKAMVDYASLMGERWQEGTTVDMNNEMMRLTMAIVAKTLFDADVESEAEDIGKTITVIIEMFPRTVLPFSEILDKLPLPSTRRFEKARERLDAIIYGMIEERRAKGEDRGDLLSMLLMAQDEEEDGRGMTDLQVRDEAMTLFLAGHETTANALTWTWYLLSQHPEAENRLHEELDTILGNRLPTVEDLDRLSYTRMVFAESMRLYPPVWAVARRAIDDYEAGGYVVPAGSFVFMSQYVTHRDARYYPDPLRFDPERWTPEQQASRPQFAYFPFGGGPRRCIGESFAWMEGILVLSTLARKWKAGLVPGHRVELKPLITLRPKYGMLMTLEQR